MWFNRYNCLNFKVHFFKWTCSRANLHEYSVITNQTLHNFFVNSSNVSVMNVSCPLSVFKLSVQNVHQLQQHTKEVSFEMTGLLYQWTPVANHSISIATKQGTGSLLLGNVGRFWRVFLTASHGDVVTGVHFGLFVHKVKLCIRLKYQRGYFLCQNRSSITCSVWKMHIWVQIVIIFECNQILQWNLQDMWPDSSSENVVNLAIRLTTIPEISNFS